MSLKVKVILNISNVKSWLIAIHPKNHFVYGLGKAYGADKITINVENQQKPNRTLWMRSLNSIYKTKVSISMRGIKLKPSSREII